MTLSSPPRKGATRIADIPPDVLAALERGELATATLTEGLAIDQARLLRTVFPDLHAAHSAAVEAAAALGILKRMAAMGALLAAAWGRAGVERCLPHVSDTVRGWGCFVVGTLPELDLPTRLEVLRPFADDVHFGVREWAWMAVRPHLATDLPRSVALLEPWAAASSERVRRFACEALRPRGVWCAHLGALKREPALALPILNALRADASTYVQDSVANWLNDAGKDHPDWLRQLCAAWRADAPSPATERICRRALRNLP